MRDAEKAPNIFTTTGEEWVESLLDELGRANGPDDYKAIHEKYEVCRDWGCGDYKKGSIPKMHSSYGQLVETDKPQFLLTSGDLIGYNEDVTKVANKNNSDPRINLRYSTENFGRVRIYHEAKARGYDHLFAPLTGWDGKHFRWVTLEKLSVGVSGWPHVRKKEIRERLDVQDLPWVIHDEEYAEIDGEPVFLDYGMFWYDGDWKTTEAELFDGPGHPFGTEEERRTHRENAEWSPSDLNNRFSNRLEEFD